MTHAHILPGDIADGRVRIQKRPVKDFSPIFAIVIPDDATTISIHSRATVEALIWALANAADLEIVSARRPA